MKSKLKKYFQSAFPRFVLVGALSYAVDVTVFNLMSAALTENHFGALIAKTTSVAVSTVFAWLGNRNFTFRTRSKRSYPKDLSIYLGIGCLATLINLLPLFVTHYVLLIDSIVMDNISANLVGFALATAFRFFSYNTFLYKKN